MRGRVSRLVSVAFAAPLLRRFGLPRRAADPQRRPQLLPAPVRRPVRDRPGGRAARHPHRGSPRGGRRVLLHPRGQLLLGRDDRDGLAATRRTCTPPEASSSPGCWCSSGWRSSPRSPGRSWASSSTSSSRRDRAWVPPAIATTSSSAGGTPPRASWSPSSTETTTSAGSWSSTTPTRTPPATTSTSSAATSPTPTTCAGPGIEEAMAAVVCPADASNEADMRSILTVMAIEAIAPQVRTVVEVNNPQHVEHFRRANADEIMVTSRIASRLLARSSLYPGLAELVTDIVSGGEGSELYRVALPDRLHRALRRRALRASCAPTTRRRCWRSAANGHAHVNPPTDFRLARGRRRGGRGRVTGDAGAAGASSRTERARPPSRVTLAARVERVVDGRARLATASLHGRRRPGAPPVRDTHRLAITPATSRGGTGCGMVHRRSIHSTMLMRERRRP